VFRLKTKVCFIYWRLNNYCRGKSGQSFAITSVTIDALIAIAVRKLKITFRHDFNLSKEVSDQSKQFLYENRFDKNLIIQFHKVL
jgi:hypothetical protein